MGIPTNIVDAASAIKDGAVGLIPMVKIGDVIVSALTGLQTPREKDVTRRPVQAGFEVVMGAVKVPTDIVLDVVLANPNFAPEALVQAALTGDISGFTATWREKKSQLEQYFDDDVVVETTTHENTYPARIISRITPTYDAVENWDCWIAQIVLTPLDPGQAAAAAGVAGAMTAAMSSVGAL